MVPVVLPVPEVRRELAAGLVRVEVVVHLVQMDLVALRDLRDLRVDLAVQVDPTDQAELV